MEKNRSVLKVLFRDGARPNGNDFSDLFDSFVHRLDDNFNFANNQTTIGNFTLGNFSATPQNGSMRFNGSVIQYYVGGAWKSVGGDTQAFTPLASQSPTVLSDIAYRGKVGINIGPAPSALVDNLEVGTVSAKSTIRTGTAVIGNNGVGTSKALFFHNSLRDPIAAPNAGNVDLNFAIGQDSDGSVSINTVNGKPINLCNNSIPFAQFKNGIMMLGNTTEIPGLTVSPPGPVLLHVHGHAAKTTGAGTWLYTSDLRAKKDIAAFDDGLEKIKALRTVSYTYNGKCGTTAGETQIGVVGQEVEEIMPYMVKRCGNPGSEQYPENMILLDVSPLMFVMVNAIKELDSKIEQLQQKS